MLSSLAWNEQLPPGRVWRNYHIQGPPNRLRRSGGTRRRVHQGSHGRQPRCERFQKEEISTSVRRCWVPTPQVLDFFPKTQGVLDFVTLIRPWFNRQWAPAAETPFHWFSHSGRLLGGVGWHFSWAPAPFSLASFWWIPMYVAKGTTPRFLKGLENVWWMRLSFLFPL